MAGNIKGKDIVDNSIKGDKISENAIDNVHLADGSVTTNKIADNSINGAKITENSINTLHIRGGSITSEKIYDGAITESKIADGVIPDLTDINESISDIIEAQGQYVTLASHQTITGSKDFNIRPTYNDGEDTFALLGEIPEIPDLNNLDYLPTEGGTVNGDIYVTGEIDIPTIRLDNISSRSSSLNVNVNGPAPVILGSALYDNVSVNGVTVSKSGDGSKYLTDDGSYKSHEDINTDNYVTTDTAQQITGNKTFTGILSVAGFRAAESGITTIGTSTNTFSVAYANRITSSMGTSINLSSSNNIEVNRPINGVDLTSDGDGSKYLADDGVYKELQPYEAPDLSEYLPLSGGVITNDLHVNGNLTSKFIEGIDVQANTLAVKTINGIKLNGFPETPQLGDVSFDTTGSGDRVLHDDGTYKSINTPTYFSLDYDGVQLDIPILDSNISLRIDANGSNARHSIYSPAGSIAVQKVVRTSFVDGAPEHSVLNTQNIASNPVVVDEIVYTEYNDESTIRIYTTTAKYVIQVTIGGGKAFGEITKQNI